LPYHWFDQIIDNVSVLERFELEVIERVKRSLWRDNERRLMVQSYGG
jgi:hypothetical protein